MAALESLLIRPHSLGFNELSNGHFMRGIAGVC